MYDIFKAYKKKKSEEDYMKNVQEGSLCERILSRPIEYFVGATRNM